MIGTLCPKIFPSPTKPHAQKLAQYGLSSKTCSGHCVPKFSLARLSPKIIVHKLLLNINNLLALSCRSK